MSRREGGVAAVQERLGAFWAYLLRRSVRAAHPIRGPPKAGRGRCAVDLWLSALFALSEETAEEEEGEGEREFDVGERAVEAVVASLTEREGEEEEGKDDGESDELYLFTVSVVFFFYQPFLLLSLVFPFILSLFVIRVVR